MGFKPKDQARTYEARDGDTLQDIAGREQAAGNDVSDRDIALYNWGTDDPDTIDEFLRDELGCTARGTDKRFVISGSDQPRNPLLIPERFEQGGLAITTRHTVRVRSRTAPPQFLGCYQIPGVTFEFDKSFIRPSVVDHMEKLEQGIENHPEAKILIFGHTDKVGNEAYNQRLSERRALSTYAFITDDPDTWEALYNEEGWGLRVVQIILDDLGYDPGPADGIDGPKTRAAVKAFQGDEGLVVDGIAGPATRRVLFLRYMTGKHDVELGPERFLEPRHVGCGEFNPKEPVETANEDNRRVTFFLFSPDRPPRLPCAPGSDGPCRTQMAATGPRYRESFRCSFYDSIAHRCPCEGGTAPPLARGAHWDRVRVSMGDTGWMLFTASEVPGGIPVTFTVFQEFQGTRKEIGKTIVTSHTGGAKAPWTAWFNAKTAGPPVEIEAPANFPFVSFHFTAVAGGVTAETKEPTVYSDSIELDIGYDTGEGIDEREYRLYSPWGMRHGKSTKTGTIRADHLPPGGVAVHFGDGTVEAGG